MQLIQTNDRANRQSFRDALQHKVEAALNTPPPSAPIVPDQVLLLPHNYEEFNAKDLHFNLMHNPELKHSRQSANLAVDIVYGTVSKPENVQLQTVKIENPVKIPQFAAPKPVKRSAPKQLTSPDYTAEFKQFVADFASKDVVATIPAKPKPVTDVTILLPENWGDLSENDLHYKLTHNTELAHSHESALFALDILYGRTVKPETVNFKLVTDSKTVKAVSAQTPKLEIKPAPIDQPREVAHRNKFKQALADKAQKALNVKPEVTAEVSLRTVLVPVGYKSMSDGELHYALVRNPEFKHTNQQAVATVDMLSGRIVTPENVKFSIQEVENLNLAPVVAPAKPKSRPVFKPATKAAMLARAEIRVTDSPAEGEKVILIPHNFAEMTETQIHFALSHNREYGHSHESVYEALDLMFGRKAQPKGIVFSPIRVENPIERAY